MAPVDAAEGASTVSTALRGRITRRLGIAAETGELTRVELLENALHRSVHGRSSGVLPGLMARREEEVLHDASATSRADMAGVWWSGSVWPESKRNFALNNRASG